MARDQFPPQMAQHLQNNRTLTTRPGDAISLLVNPNLCNRRRDMILSKTVHRRPAQLRLRGVPTQRSSRTSSSTSCLKTSQQLDARRIRVNSSSNRISDHVYKWNYECLLLYHPRLEKFRRNVYAESVRQQWGQFQLATIRGIPWITGMEGSESCQYWSSVSPFLLKILQRPSKQFCASLAEDRVFDWIFPPCQTRSHITPVLPRYLEAHPDLFNKY